MMKVWVSPSLVEIEALRGRLEEAGIACVVKNQFTSTLAGEVPFAEVFPELWVLDDRQADEAKTLFAKWKGERDAIGSTWACRTCGEQHGPQFTHCWKCGASRG